jgi:hypothetical protein
MIEAIGKQNLTNAVRGSVKGEAKGWRATELKEFGVHQLW